MITARALIPYIDYTNLSQELDQITLLGHCLLAAEHQVAAICVQPQYVAFCRQTLGDSTVKLATVFNFPNGDQPLTTILTAINQAIEDGADEFDVVIPLKEDSNLLDFVCTIRESISDKVLKVIIATDVLQTPERIKAASQAVIAGKADFIKTCTGMHGQGVTLDAVNCIVDEIKNSDTQSGIKVSGGIKTIDFAQQLYAVVCKGLGIQLLTPQQFRIGASQLLPNLLTPDDI